MNATTQAESTAIDIDEQQQDQLPAVRKAGALAIQPQAINQAIFSQSESFLLALMDRGATPELINQVMDLRDRQDAKLADQAMSEAVAAFKAEAISIIKTKHVGFKTEKGGRTDYDHAELGNVIDIITPRLSEHGLSINWKPTEQTKDWVRVTCTLKHVKGASEVATLGAGPDASGGKNSIQAIGSACSYLSRYLTLMMLGLAARGQDNDGRGDARDGEPTKTDASAAAASDTYPAADFERNLPTWTKYIEAGRKTPEDIVLTVKAKKPFSPEQEKQIRAIKCAV